MIRLLNWLSKREDTDCFSLPEGVHNGTSLVTDHVVVPQPGLWVDGLTDRSQHLQGAPVIPTEGQVKSSLNMHILRYVANASPNMIFFKDPIYFRITPLSVYITNNIRTH